MEMKFCQSCGMPLTPEILGTNADGSKNEDYCIYCYKDGAFTGDFNMEQMVEFCSQFVDEFNKNTGKSLTRERARALPAKNTRRNFASISLRSSAGASRQINCHMPHRP